MDEEKITVSNGLDHGMKSFGIDAKTFDGVGTTGMVPKPVPGDEEKYLKADGTWSYVPLHVDDELDPTSHNAVSNSAVCGGLDVLDNKIIELDGSIQPIPVETVHLIIDPSEPAETLDFDNEN
jgi:hypothetical protein